MSRALLVLATVTLVACGSTPNADAGPGDGGPAMCGAPGMPSVGAADTHCDPGIVQPTSQASCAGLDVDAFTDVDAGVPDCEYGAPLFGASGDDDDCKYHFAWSSTPICQGRAGVFFTVVVTSKVDGSPVTGADMRAETFIPGGTACDAIPMHTGPNSFVHLREGPLGTYVGPIEFDHTGEWNVRFHVFESCSDVPAESPHGHVAFRVTVP